MPTLEQERAGNAWEKAQCGIRKYGKNYVNDVKGLPALIMNSGLMQTMAFLHSKHSNDKRHEFLAQQLREWLAVRYELHNDFNGFMGDLYTMNDASRFQAITSEALAWLHWLRLMAAARAE